MSQGEEETGLAIFNSQDLSRYCARTLDSKINVALCLFERASLTNFGTCGSIFLILGLKKLSFGGEEETGLEIFNSQDLS